MKDKKGGFLNIILSPEISILIPLIIICAYTGARNPNFFLPKNIQVIIRYTAFVGTLAVGEAFALMCGEIDLSIGTLSALSSCIFAASIAWWGLSIPVALGLSLITGVVIGMANAFLTLRFKMSSWIVTMAMQYICSGLATVICKGQAIGKLGPWVQAANTGRPMGLSYMFFVFLTLLIISEIVMRFTPVGRKVHSVGISVPAAKVAGINVTKVKMLCMMFSGLMGATCGILQTLSNSAANASVGKGNEFAAIIACAIGGVSTSGGKGSMLGVLIGVFMYQTLKNCLQTLGFNANTQLVLTGLILILAVLVDVIKVRINQRAKVAKS